MVEFLAQRLGDDGADEEEGGGHGFPRSVSNDAFRALAHPTLAKM